MKKQVFLFIFLILSVVLVNAQIQQNEDTGTRGSFLSTRPALEKPTSSSSEKPVRKKTDTSQKKNIKKADVNKTKSILGLGYTLYLKGKNDEPVRVSPTREFQAQEAIRIVVEPNTDGYLYVFHTENDGQPTMIFPDARLKRGDNTVQAHVPYEVPSSDNPETELQWFVFDEKSATENIYLVLSRVPLDKVPSSEELVKYCQEKLCPWRPSEVLWQSLKSSINTPVKVSKNNNDQGEVQSTTEKRSIKETVALAKQSSAPTVIYMHGLAESDKLVTPVSLVHK